MPDLLLTCPACRFTRAVPARTIPATATWVTCPKCRHPFPLPLPTPAAHAGSQPGSTPPEPTPAPITPPAVEAGGDLRQPSNLRFALLFAALVIALLAGRLYCSERALHAPAPNFIAASEQGIATLWGDEVLVTDPDGSLLRRVTLPGEVTPTHLTWAGEELWLADYRSKRILILGAGGQRWLPLKGPKISAHFKVVPDFSTNCIFVSAGHGIQVYDLQGEFRYAFGKEGQRPGELKFPNQFLLDESGELLIANTKSPAIDRYAPDGRFLARVVKPTGHADYRYPTNVALAPERIVTLEADGFLQDARIALYDRHGRYLGSHEEVKDFKLIGDIAVWGDRVLATDLANARVYAFAAEDLRFLGDYSGDLQRLGEASRRESGFWSRLAGFCLWGMLALLVPVIWFYARFRSGQAGAARVQAPPVSGAVETLEVGRKHVPDRVDLDLLGPLEFIAVETRPVFDILAFALLGAPLLTLLWLRFNLEAIPRQAALAVMPLVLLTAVAGALLSVRSSWGCPVSLKKARKHLATLLRNRGTEVLAGVERVGIGFCVDKTSVLLLVAPRQLTIAEFDWFGRLSGLCRLPRDGVAVDDQRFVLPAIALRYGEKKKILQDIDRRFLNRLRAALENGRDAAPAGSVPPGQAPGVAAPGSAGIAGPGATKKRLHPQAALLSALFPGLGQFYKRHIVRGALFMALFAPVALSLAINIEPTLAGSIDWAPESVARVALVLMFGLPLYAVNLWDALKN
jgi:hypothetical protein